MSDKSDSGSDKAGIAGLPKSWGAAVQLISTFGLAVFLVLYYVLVMRPEENARYDQLRTSVESLIKVVESGSTLVTRDQGLRLQELYVDAIAYDLAREIHRRIAASPDPQALAADLKRLMIARTDVLQGITRKDGGTISEMLARQIEVTDVATILAKHADENLRSADLSEIVDACRGILRTYLREIAAAK